MNVIEATDDKFVVGLEVEMEDDMNDNRIKYIVKPEDKVVVGILNISLDEYLEKTLFDQMSNHYSVIAYESLKKGEWCLGRLEIKAIARCADSDEFDETFGKKLVEARIYKKLHNKIKNLLRKAVKDMWKTAYILEQEEVKHGRKESYIQKDLEGYFNVKG